MRLTKQLLCFNFKLKQTSLSNKMRRRHSFTRPGIDQLGGNHSPTDQSYFPTGRVVGPGNGPFVGQMNHMARGGVPESRANEFSSSSVGMEIQPYVAGPPVDPYSHLSITENRSSAPIGHMHCTNYNVSSMCEVSTHSTGIVRPLKRKRSGCLYSAGASSSSSSSQMPMEKPAAVDVQSAPPYRSSLTIGGEDSSRNVRRRYRLDLEPSITRPLVPSHSSQFYHSAPGQQPNLDANDGQWNHVPHYAASSHRRISPSDMSGGSRHEMNRIHGVGDGGACHRDSYFSRHPVSSSHGPSMREQHVNHSRRSESSYGNGSRYSHYAHGGTSSANGMHTLDDFSSRNYTRHSIGWRSSYRSGRPRIAVDRFPPVFDLTESHDRMRHHEAIMMVDRASFYGSSRNFSDQYRDMRLDIDNMSYEELLNLGERIGNVNTGLSEDNISKCLKEKVYRFSDQKQEEVSCPICLEVYMNGDKIGTMEKCGHDYHVECIKKWLLMKKLCPICKTECSN